MSTLPTNPNADVKRLNPHLWPQHGAQLLDAREVPGAKRLKQSEKPLMNKLEAEWFEIINAQYPNFPRPRAQAKRYRLGNGVSFTPDFTASSWPHQSVAACETAWEVKGDMAWDDAIVKIKLAPSIWPEVQWIFCWKENGEWKTQRMLP